MQMQGGHITAKQGRIPIEPGARNGMDLQGVVIHDAFELHRRGVCVSVQHAGTSFQTNSHELYIRMITML